MRYKLQSFKIIPIDSIEKLENLGIFDSDDLLFSTSSPKRRKNLSNQTNIKEDNLLKWASISDLVRIKGIGINTAIKVMDYGGIKNVNDFLFAINKKLDDETQRNSRINKPAQRDIITAAKAFCIEVGENLQPQIIANAYDEALELIPRLTLHNEEIEREKFESEVNNFFKTPLRKNLVNSFEILRPILGVFIIFLLPIIAIWALVSIFCNFVLATDATKILNGYLNLEIAIWFSQTGLLILFLSVGYLLINTFFSYTSIVEKKLALTLFDHSGYRSIFLDLMANSSKNSGAIDGFIRGGVFILGLLLITSMVILMLLKEIYGSNVVTNLNDLLLSFAVWGGVFLGVAISFSTLKFYYSRYRDKDSENEDAVQRYLIFNFVGIIRIPILFFLLFTFFIPFGIYSYKFTHNTILAPIFEKKLLETKERLLNLYGSPYEVGTAQEYIIEIDSETIPDLYSPQVSALSESSQPFFERIVGSLIWLILVAIILVLIMPYFYLGGWKRGIFYILILSFSFYAEEILQHKTPDWFYVERGSIPAFLIIAFIVFANAVFFDWMYDTLKDKKKICENCGANINIEDRFCIDCGLPQEIE